MHECMNRILEYDVEYKAFAYKYSIEMLGNRFICSNVGVDAAALVTTILAALAQTASSCV